MGWDPFWSTRITEKVLIKQVFKMNLPLIKPVIMPPVVPNAGNQCSIRWWLIVYQQIPLQRASPESNTSPQICWYITVLINLVVYLTHQFNFRVNNVKLDHQLGIFVLLAGPIGRDTYTLAYIQKYSRNSKVSHWILSTDRLDNICTASHRWSMTS